jgi:hypothetical protein
MLMPLATKAPKWRATDVVTCWNPGYDTQIDFACKRGQRLRGDHEYVRRHASDFVGDGEVVPDIRAKVEAESTLPEPMGRVKLRVLELPKHSDGRFEPRVLRRGKQYFGGDTFEAEGREAEALLDGGTVQIVKHLDRKEGK